MAAVQNLCAVYFSALLSRLPTNNLHVPLLIVMKSIVSTYFTLTACFQMLFVTFVYYNGLR